MSLCSCKFIISYKRIVVALVFVHLRRLFKVILKMDGRVAVHHFRFIHVLALNLLGSIIDAIKLRRLSCWWLHFHTCRHSTYSALLGSEVLLCNGALQLDFSSFDFSSPTPFLYYPFISVRPFDFFFDHILSHFHLLRLPFLWYLVAYTLQHPRWPADLRTAVYRWNLWLPWLSAILSHATFPNAQTPWIARHGRERDTPVGACDKLWWPWGGRDASEFSCDFLNMYLLYAPFYEDAGNERRLGDIVANVHTTDKARRSFLLDDVVAILIPYVRF